MERHRAACSSCRRYGRVVDEGVGVLREADPVPVSGEFRARLRHRLFHLRDGDLPEGGSRGSRSSGATTVALCLLAVLAAWSPLLRAPTPSVRLPPIEVGGPPERPAQLRVSPAAFFAGAPLRPELGGVSSVGEELWERPAAFLLEHSPLLAGDRWPGSAEDGAGSGRPRP